MFSQAALNASLNGTSAILLACGYAAIRNGKMKVHKAFMISAFVHDFGLCCFHFVPDLLSDLPLPRRPCSFPGSGVDSPGLLRVAPLAHGAGHRHRAADFDYVAPRMAGAIRSTPGYRALDAATLVLCLGHRSDRLYSALPGLYPARELVSEPSGYEMCRHISEIGLGME